MRTKSDNFRDEWLKQLSNAQLQKWINNKDLSKQAAYLFKKEALRRGLKRKKREDKQRKAAE